MQQFAISEATLMAWNSMDGESFCVDSNQGSVAHLSEVNQESITSRGKDDKHVMYVRYHMFAITTCITGIHDCQLNLDQLSDHIKRTINYLTEKVLLLQ